MKTNKLLMLIGLGTLAGAISAHADPTRYLILKVEKYSLSADFSSTPPKINRSDLVQKYKILIDNGFTSQFSAQPSKNSSGTAMVCNLSEATYPSAGMSFTQWFQPVNGKIKTWLWGQGSESVGGKIVVAENAKAQMTLNFPDWVSIDSQEMISFSNEVGGISNINTSISAVTVQDGDPAMEGALLMPVKGADGSVLIGGDSQAGISLAGNCAFQNN